MAKECECVVLFVHGFLGSPDFFNQFEEHIPNKYDIHKILLHGHGGSVLDFANTSMRLWKSQVSSVVSRLSAEYEKIIIIAHSMGCFFAMRAAHDFPDKVKGIFLLGLPMKIFVRPSYFTNGLRVIFNAFDEKDTTAKVIKNALGVNLNKNMWEYSGWIPRGFEVVQESKKARRIIKKLETPCMIFQSYNDEVVSNKALKYIPEKKNINVNILCDSTHFIYGKSDYIKICNSLEDFLR